jgi:murein DD-endopeptidase MepM/ murein hydrolase activator NlpD
VHLALQKHVPFLLVAFWILPEYVTVHRVCERKISKGKSAKLFGCKQVAVENNISSIRIDEKGQCLQRAFLKAPLRFTRISSRFSNSRLHPVLKIRRPHHGVDYAAPEGTPVFSVVDGTIVKKAFQRLGGGNYITIKHNGTYSTTYMHLKGYAKGMAVGKHVRQGELIGYVGKTGLATGPHLDFRFYRNGKAVDPLKVESPPSLPIEAAYRASFDSLVGVYKTRLAF